MKYYWHIHHEQLVEAAIEPIKNRLAYIKCEKPKDEVALRLRLLKPVKSRTIPRLMAEYQKVRESALAEYQKVRESALEVKVSTWAEYKKVKVSAWAPIEKLHKKECPGCPWNGKTIFP